MDRFQVVILIILIISLANNFYFLIFNNSSNNNSSLLEERISFLENLAKNEEELLLAKERENKQAQEEINRLDKEEEDLLALKEAEENYIAYEALEIELLENKINDDKEQIKELELENTNIKKELEEDCENKIEEEKIKLQQQLENDFEEQKKQLQNTTNIKIEEEIQKRLNLEKELSDNIKLNNSTNFNNTNNQVDIQTTNNKEKKNFVFTNYFDFLPDFFNVTLKSAVNVYGEIHVFLNFFTDIEIEGVVFHHLSNSYLPSFISPSHCTNYFKSDISRLFIANGTEYDNYYYFDLDIIHFRKIPTCDWISAFSFYDDYCISNAAFCFSKGSKFLEQLLQEFGKIEAPTYDRTQFGPSLLTKSFHKYRPNVTILPIDYTVSMNSNLQKCYQNFMHPGLGFKTKEYLEKVLEICTNFLKTPRDYRGIIECTT